MNNYFNLFFNNRAISYQNAYSEIEILVSLVNNGYLLTIIDTMEEREESDIIDFVRICYDIKDDLIRSPKIKDIESYYKNNKKIHKIYIRCNYDFRN